MTGLDITRDRLLQICVAVTDSNLEMKGTPLNITIHQSKSVLSTMNDWCKKEFLWNDGNPDPAGLAHRCMASAITEDQADQMICDYLTKLSVPVFTCPLAGNTVHVDKKYIEKYLPKFCKHLHYRIVDVSTVKELSRRWYPKAFETAPVKKSQHDAEADIRNSITELKHYRATVFRPQA